MTDEKTAYELDNSNKSFSLFKDNVLSKITSIVILILILLIPLEMIDSLLDERLYRRNETINNITSTWGKAQTVVGPVLIIPYLYYYKTWREEIVKDGDKEIKQQKEVVESRVINAYFLPKQLNINGELNPKELHRGIYDAIVYTGSLSINGTFDQPDFSYFKVEARNILWNDAKISFALTDLRGTRETLILELNKQKLPLIPGGSVPHFSSGVQTYLKGVINNESNGFDFSLKLTLNGSSSINFAPLGIQNNVSLKSSWKDPSFNGEFLPVKREVSKGGFNADWQISYYGRHYPQQWSDLDNKVFDYSSVNSSLFGVTLVSLIDSYRNVERSIKYGVLFITLVFTAFFLFEVVGKLKIHPFQYILVGAALCLFYLALLSFSEFISFLTSYISAACASTILITLYCLAVLKSGKRCLLIAAGLITTYGFLYVTLQATDYALIIGTIGLFMALSLVMYATRHIDWYAHGTQPVSK